MSNLIANIRFLLGAALDTTFAAQNESGYDAVRHAALVLCNLQQSDACISARFAGAMATLQAADPTTFAAVESTISVAATAAEESERTAAARLQAARAAFYAGLPRLPKRSRKSRWNPTALHAIRKADFYGAAESNRLAGAADARRAARAAAKVKTPEVAARNLDAIRARVAARKATKVQPFTCSDFADNGPVDPVEAATRHAIESIGAAMSAASVE